MEEFLKTVAKHYVKEVSQNDGSVPPLALKDYLFVFPNRRSGLFLNHYIHELIEQPIVAPRMYTISELFDMLNNGIVIPEKIELLFILYDVYKRISKSDETFDNFVFWGEMLLSDFNDADKYLVNVKQLFTNIKDLKEIDEAFSGLTDEQIKIIRTFWTNFRPDYESDKKEVFRQTWKILYEIYAQFNSELEKHGKSYEGHLQREIIEQIKTGKEIDISKFGKKIIFVGLTALSKTEMQLMLYLKKCGIAEFCWDYADPRLNDKESHASYFKRMMKADFPNVLSDEVLKNGIVPDTERVIDVIAVPSGVGQTIQAANLLKSDSNTIKTAIVLPDEKLLLPMLYAIPEGFEKFNVTMGYSLKATTIASLVNSIAYLQTNIKKDKNGETTFYYKNVTPVLSHNLLLNLTDGKAIQILAKIDKENLFRVRQSDFAGNELLEAVFKECKDGKDCLNYLKNIFAILEKHAEMELEAIQETSIKAKEDLFSQEEEEAQPISVFNDLDREFLYSYIKIIDNLEEKIAEYNVDFNVATLFSILHKLSQSEIVAFSGEPLSGLQIMGVLETRSLDFNNLIILSMNEGIFPAKPVTNTFIPMNLRNAFGMPTQQHRDAVYAYHFYRLISRAKHVTLIYDSRSEGLQNGEPSRYIKQLEYLYNVKTNTKTVNYNIGIEETNSITIKKDDRIMDRLHQCFAGVGKRKISASALKHYIDCPLRFYLEFVEGLSEEDEVIENIDDKTFGSILHKAMEVIYNAVKGKLVSYEHLNNVINDEPLIRKIIVEAFHTEMKVDDIEGYLHIVEEILVTYVKDILEHDKCVATFAYISSEDNKDYVYKVHDENGKLADFSINVKTILDRVDRLQDGTTRIVDYKTGNSSDSKKLNVPEISSIFEPNSSCSNEAFQVLMYCLLYGESKLSPNLYFVRDFHKEIDLNTELRLIVGKNQYEQISNFDTVKAEFKKAFDSLLVKIFDPNIDFKQCDKDTACTYCPFTEICGRGKQRQE